MSLPTPTQQSQFGRTHENFCIRFCEQIEKNCAPNAVASPQYSAAVNKVFTQMSDETRWKKFCNFLKKKSELDGGDLLNRFSSCWFKAIERIENARMHTTRMFSLIFELMNGDSLKAASLIGLHSTIVTQLQSFEKEELSGLCALISDRFVRGGVVSKRWVGVATEVLKRLGDTSGQCFEFAGKSLNSCAYRHHFLLKLLDDVLVTDSFIALISLLRNSSLEDILVEYAEELLMKELDAQVATKLISLLTSLPTEVTEKVMEHMITRLDGGDDLLALCTQLFEVFHSNVSIARTTFTLLKKDRHLVTSKLFALMCMLSICDTPRVHSSALCELKQSIVKLWRHADKLKESSWIKSAVGECDIEALKRNFDTLINAISTEQKWSTLVGRSLQDVAFMLITDKGKADLKITNGRIDGDAGVLLMGKRLLVTVAGTQPAALNTLLDRIFRCLSVCTSHNSSLVLIDVIVSVVLEHTAHVLNSWKSLRRLTDVVCCLKEETGVALVRALLPVIVQREQLVAAIVTQMRRHVLCETTASTALPILLLLLKSSTIRAAVRNDQFSQSFATFSTQALQTMGINTTIGNSNAAIEVISILKRALSQPASTRSLLYKGIVEAAYANENLVDALLDLLCTHLASTAPISREAYVESTKTSTVLLEPLPELIQAVSVLIRLAIHALRNTSTQVVSARDAQVATAVAHIERLIEFVRDSDVHDLQVDKLSDFSTSTMGRANLAFATMLISLYDVLVEHLWHVGNALLRKDAAEKIASILRRKDELNDVLKEKMAKKKESKLGKTISVAMCCVYPQLQTISLMISRFIQKRQNNEDDVNEECIMVLRECVFSWAVQWAAKIANDLRACAPNASSVSLCAFARANLLLYVGGEHVDPAASLQMWNHTSTEAIVAFASAISLIVSKYGPRSQTAIVELWRCLDEGTTNSREVTLNGASMRLLRYILTDRMPKLLDAYKDFDERKMSAEHSKQALALLSASRALISVVPNAIDKFQVASFKFLAGILQKHEIKEKPVLREVWNLLIEVSRRGSCDKRYTNFLKAAASQIVSTLADDSVSEEQMFESITESTVTTSIEMLVNACSMSLSDVRQAVDIISEPATHADVNAGLVVSLDLCGRLAEVVDILLPVHVVYAVLKEPICTLLTSLYTTLNAVVKLLLIKQKSTDISEWKCVSELALLAHGHVLRIMESADENVGTLNPLDEPNMKRQRKYTKSLKDETLYVSYARTRELYQANLLLLSSALHDDRLDVQVRHNTIGVRDFRIDAEKLRQRLEQIGAREGEDSGDGDEETPPPLKKRRGQLTTANS